MPANESLVKEAIARNTPISLILPDGGLSHTCRSRFLSYADGGILLEAVGGRDTLLDTLVNSGESIKVSFRSDVRKVEFETTLLRRLKAHRLNATTLVEALLIQSPTEITAVQRRSDYRVSVPQEETLKFSFWRVSEQDDFTKIPAETARIIVDVRDCSAGGIGGIWKRRTSDPTSLAADQRFRVDVESAVGKQTFDGRLRFLENLPDQFFKRIGLQFTMQATNLSDRQKTMFLNKLMSELQRMELRRKKIGR